MTRIRPVLFCILLKGLFVLSSASAGAATSAAFLDADRSPLGAVLESKLLANSALTWIEIADLGDVLKEQDLQAAFSPEALKQRVNIGLLAKTDLVVLLRRAPAKAAEPGSTHLLPLKQLDLVICETRYGMRLGAHSVSVSSNVEEQASQLKLLVDQAIARFSRPRPEICAVRPFDNRNQIPRCDYLRGAYAEVLKQFLLDYDDLALIESPEAEALAKEAAPADAKNKQARRLPLVFAGEYQHSGEGESRKVHVKLRLLRGDQQLGTIEKKDLQPDAVLDFLRRSLAELLATVIPATPPKQDAAIAARQLLERSRECQRFGNWDEAISLIEASVLLRPDDRESRHDAVVVSGRLAHRYFYYFYERKDLASSIAALRWYQRGVEHLEAFLRETPDLSYYRGSNGRTLIDELVLMGLSRPDEPELQEAYIEVMDEIKKVLLRIVGMRIRQKQFDGSSILERFTKQVPDDQHFAVIEAAIFDVQHLPDIRQRIKRLVTLTFQDSQIGRAFLRRLAEDKNPQLNAAAQDLQKRLQDALARQSQPQPRPITPATAPAPATESAEVTFRLLEFKQDDTKPLGRPFVNWRSHQVGEGIDLVWEANRVCLMKAPGELKLIWTGNDLNDNIAMPSNFGYYGEHVSFDGKYAWAAISRIKEEPSLLVIDPKTEKVWELGAKDGLPTASAENLKEKVQRSYFAVTAIEPGKACVVGSFGRTWIAIVTFRQDERPLVEIVHECLEAVDVQSDDQWKKSTVVFNPTYMFTLGEPKSPERCILLGRINNNRKTAEHPLVIDPVRRTVRVLEESFPHVQYDNVFAVHDGALYALDTWSGAFMRFVPPKLHREYLLPQAPRGKLLFQRGEFHILGDKWWRYNIGDKKMRVAAESVPWCELTRGPPPSGKSRLESIHSSGVYGLIALTRRYDSEAHAAYHVELSPQRGDVSAIQTKQDTSASTDATSSEVVSLNSQDLSPDERAARWILFSGGMVWVGAPGRIATLRRTLAELPAPPYTLDSISLGLAPRATTPAFANLSALKNLRAAYFTSSAMDNDRMACLKSLRSLRILSVRSGPATDAGLVHLQDLTDLIHLDLASTRITDEGLESLQTLVNLQRLKIGDTKVKGAGLQHLAPLQNLVELDLMGLPITDESLRRMPAFSNLGRLNLNGTEVTSASIEYLRPLGKLEYLDLSRTSVDDAGLQRLAGHDALNTLVLTGCPVTSVGLVSLKKCSRLQSLYLNGCPISDESLEPLQAMTNLTRLYLSKTQVTKSGIEKLKAALPKCQVYQ